MRVILPWPDRILSPNSRPHWRRKAAVVKVARQHAAMTALATRGFRAMRARLAGDGPLPLTITFFPPDARRRDRDNMQASLKHALDGLADALGVDDCRFVPTYTLAEPQAPGRVVIEISISEDVP